MKKRNNGPVEKSEKVGTRSVTSRVNKLEEVVQLGIQDLKNQISDAPKSPEILETFQF